jgi:hypothetical protein
MEIKDLWPFLNFKKNSTLSKLLFNYQALIIIEHVVLQTALFWVILIKPESTLPSIQQFFLNLFLIIFCHVTGCFWLGLHYLKKKQHQNGRLHTFCAFRSGHKVIKLFF